MRHAAIRCNLWCIWVINSIIRQFAHVYVMHTHTSDKPASEYLHNLWMNLYYSACIFQWNFKTQNLALCLSLSLSLSLSCFTMTDALAGAQNCVLQQIGPA